MDALRRWALVRLPDELDNMPGLMFRCSHSFIHSFTLSSLAHDSAHSAMVTKPPVHTHTHSHRHGLPERVALGRKGLDGLGVAVGEQRAGRHSVVLEGGGGESRSQSSGARFLAGMMKTATCALHETDRESCRLWAFGVRSLSSDLKLG